MGRFSFGSAEFIKSLKGIGIGAVGVLATYGLSTVVPELAKTNAIYGALMAAAASAGFNALYQWAKDNSNKK